MAFKAVAKHAPVYVSVSVFATEDTDTFIFTADRPYEVVEIIEVHSATDAAGTVEIEKVPSGTAIGSGTDIQASTFDIGSTANTPVHKTVGNGGLSTTRSDRQLARGDSLALDYAGTLNDTYQGAVTVVLKPIGPDFGGND